MYKFYYDESEHSRKINLNTVSADNYYDNFISFIVGWETSLENELESKYIAFERKHECRKSDDELKSSTFKKKQFKYGFASLNNDNVELLTDFFDVFNNDIKLCYCIISKIEYVILQVFSKYENELFIDMDSFKYSITKLIVTYKPTQVINNLFGNIEDFVPSLVLFIKKKLKFNISNRKLKERENEAFRQILIILDNVEGIKKVDWNYKISFLGFREYLKENQIFNYSLIIDEEGDEGNTLHGAVDMELKNVSEADSKNTFGIRIADMIAGITSKLLKSINVSLNKNSNNGVLQKNLLPREWFNLTDKKLLLYHKLYYIIVELNNCWYKSFNGKYADDLIALVTFLRFIHKFKSVDDLKRDSHLLPEYFNSATVSSLEAHYDRMRSKLSTEFVNSKSEYILNRYNAKVYKDADKQPSLPLKNNVWSGIAYSIGLSSDFIPLVTIKEGDTYKCYKLSTSLTEWAYNCVALANSGSNIFPCEVKFTIIDNLMTAEII